jgi:hypothetical protein
MSNIIVRPQDSLVLPDNKTFTNRFEIRSETSNAIYIIAQSKKGRWWSCSCFGWLRFRKCKHLITLGLPCLQKPFEAQLETSTKQYLQDF